ncbi:hypothetical protein [Streptomyces sp. CBMA152]|uniref:hypothetical protein n=1 Tax=Streptomyces sp. CBMA152 TaxID=1896312 RepID=UPI0016605234|nr:hypothetical protein [Streptomyces sp. CBMA152]MBD0741508.1 hypothetical protein [Streptomyces sp. CBMA152]
MALALGWLWWLLKELKRLCRLANRDRGRPADGVVPPWAYRQPDPLIYSQRYLQAHGFAVTWDNPDIHVELASAPGVPVDAHALQPDTKYLVVARVWNGSTTAPAPGLPVRVSYLEFGVGTTRHDVGTTKVDLPVKGALGCPAVATVPWRTPAAPGHYCLQVELLWDDDANPDNNMGQSNTDVKPLNSPHAAFTFPVRNDRADQALVTLRVDGYAIPPLESCGASEGKGEGVRRSRLARHRAERWPVPDGWRVAVNPAQLPLAPGEQSEVAVDITAPDGFTGRQAVNVHADIGDDLLGGVTLYVDGTG